MNKVIIPVFALWVAGMLSACDQFFCGSLDPAIQKRVDRVEAKYGDKVKVEPIPCEFSYVNIILKSKDTSGALLDAVHSILHDSTTREGWATMLVFDKKRKYMFSHDWRGGTFKQTGD